MDYSDNYEDKKKYVRKSLEFKLPFFGEPQAAKNPFSAICKTKSMMQCINLSLVEIADETRPRKCITTIHKWKKFETCADFKQIQKPRQELEDSMEIIPTDQFEEDEEQIPEESEIITNPPPSRHNSQNMQDFVIDTKTNTIEKLTLLSEFSVCLTEDVEKQFAIMVNRGFIAMDEVAKKSVKFPQILEKEKMNTLLLDLDDTLVHTMNWGTDYSKTIIDHKDVKQIIYNDKHANMLITLQVILRPYVKEFLKEMSSMFEIAVIYT